MILQVTLVGLQGKGEEGSSEINTVAVLGGLNQLLGKFKMATFNLISVADHAFVYQFQFNERKIWKN